MLAQYWMDDCGDVDDCIAIDFCIDGTIDTLDLYQLALSWLGEEVMYIHVPISLWKFDEQTGNSAADSVGENHGTLTNFPTDDSQWTGGKVDNALSFDGIDDYVTADTVSADIAGGDFTLTAWVKSDSTATQQFIAAFNDAAGGNRLLIGHTAGLSGLLVYDNGTRQESGEVAFDGTWHHIAVVLNDTADSVTMYVDGDNVHTYSTTTTIDPTDLFSIGQEYDGLVTGDFYNGLLDEVMIYDEALSQDEILWLYTKNQ